MLCRFKATYPAERIDSVRSLCLLYTSVQDRQGAEGGDSRHERRDGACAVRLYLYARNGCERPETVCGYPSSRYAMATVRLATA